MSKGKTPRGAAPVGYLIELPFVEAAAVQYLRLWCSGPAYQDDVWNDFASLLGPHESRLAMQNLGDLCKLISERRSRPMMRHTVQSKCLGADESIFANLIGAASDGEEQDTLLFAALLVDAKHALAAVRSAESFARSLKLMSPQHDQVRTHTVHQDPIPNRLH